MPIDEKLYQLLRFLALVRVYFNKPSKWRGLKQEWREEWL